MHHSSVLLTAFAVSSLAFSLSAQSPSFPIGLTENSPRLATISVGGCNATSVCNPPIGPSIMPWAGGTAHDPRDRATWVSDGLLLAKVDPRTGCTVECPPSPAPLAAAGTEVTGLALNEQNGLLFISYANNTIATFANVGCTLTLLSSCAVPGVPANHIISGLACNDATGELYMGSSPWLGALPAMFALVHRAPQASPCGVLCSFQIPGCFGTVQRLITGLGFDACTDSLYATDGFGMNAVVNPSSCAPLPTSACCPQLGGLGGERLVGLCILPSTEVSTGNICFAGTSPFCPGMRHVLGGDPTIGNLSMSLDLVGPPNGSLALCFIGLGPCTGPGSTYSILCTGLIPTTFWGAAFTPPGVGCGTGVTSVPFPIPAITVLCGITLSSQYVGQLPPGWSGNYVSNCLSWMISAS